MMAMLQRSEELMMAMMENNQRGNYGGKESMLQRSDEATRCVLTIIGQVWWQRGNDGNHAKINEAIMVAKSQCRKEAMRQRGACCQGQVQIQPSPSRGNESMLAIGIDY